MDNIIPIEVTVKGKEYSFEAKLEKFGYTYKIVIEINTHKVTFEPDEERNYRATIDSSVSNSVNEKEKEIIKEISDMLNKLNVA